MEICDKKICTGCCTCMNVCPQKAITIVCDSLGKTVPKIDENKCTQCQLCVKKCPMNNELNTKKPRCCYALWTNSKKDRETCASGGVATTFSRFVMREKGVVFGSGFDENLDLMKQMAKTEDDLEKFKGSKYVKSEIGFSYQQVKEKLDSEIFVLFIGMPCQIDGLNHYLGKEYKNLITVDFICHGTPPGKYLKEYVKSLVPDRDVTNISFRGEYDNYFTLYDKEDVLYCKQGHIDLYYRSFLNSLIYNDNCYQCRYASINRVSDITIGDFWGIDRNTLSNQYEGRISVALINTNRGQLFFDEVKYLFTYEARTIKEAFNGNCQLRRPAKAHPNREKFEEEYKKNGFVKAVKSTKIPKDILKSKVREQLVSPFRPLKKFMKN